MNCEKHGCPLTPLFTSAFCARCDEESAVNADVSKIMKHVYSHDADGKELQFGSPHHTHDVGWYHNYPVCGTDANGSDVDDMDVCMGMVVGRRHLHKVGLRQEALDALRNAQDTPQPDVCMGLRVGDCVIVDRDYMGNAGRIGTISHAWEDGCMCVGFDLDDSVFTHASNLRSIGDVKKDIYDAAYADWLASRDDA